MSLFLIYSVSQPLDLHKANKSQRDNKNKRKVTNKTQAYHQLWLWLLDYRKTWQVKQNHWHNQRGCTWLQTMRNTNSVAFPQFAHTFTDTYIQSCAHSSQRQRQHSCVFLWLGDGARERESDQLLVGEDGAAAVPHRRITLERTHHLCSFVELSHFNPQPSPLGTDFTNPPQPHSPTTTHPHNAEPHSGAPHSPHVIQCCCCQHFHLCAAVVWCQVHTHKLAPTPKTTGLPHSLVKITRWGGEDEGLLFMLICVPYNVFFCYLS